MNEVLKQYLVTALWSSVDDDGTPLDSNYDIEDVNSDSIGQSEADLNEFIDQASKFEGFSKCDLTDVAHDFWLTRNGHGAGFWDGDYPKKLGEQLTELAHTFREVHAIVGDDDKIYFE